MEIINFVCIENCPRKRAEKGNWVLNIKLNLPEIPYKWNLIWHAHKRDPVAKYYWFWTEHIGARYEL